VSAAAQRLSSDRPEVVEAAIKTLGAIRTRKAQRVLHDYLRPLYRQARLNLAALEHVASVRLCEAARDALTDGLVDSNRRIVRRVLAVKSALGNRRDINLLLSLIQTNEPRVRSNAIEALTSLPTGRLIRPVLALLEVRESSAAEGPKPTHSDRASVADPAVAVWRAAADDRWLRLLAARLFAHRDEGIRSDGDDAMLDLIIFLKSVPLFREMSFEDVARIADKTERVAVAQGEVLFEGGESITHVHIVRSGRIELYRDGMTVEVMVAGASVGEHAIFGNARQEVSARAATESLLLRLPVSIISDLVAENPQSLGPVVGDLMRRVNLLHARLASLVRRPAGSQQSRSSIDAVVTA
jgi:Cyclic nucleotide-binding domain